MSKIMFIGRSGSGKTTLCQRLHAQSLLYSKTQAVEHYNRAIDTPGEYLEMRSLYRALIVTAADAQVLGLVVDATQLTGVFPQGFGSMFDKECVGIVTKADIASKEGILLAGNELRAAGCERVFVTDALSPTSTEKLFGYLAELGV